MADAVYDAIKGYIVANFATIPVSWENEWFDPAESGAWARVEVEGTSYGQQSIGESLQANNRWDEEGLVWLRVFVPVGGGVTDARGYAKQMANLFRGVTLLSGGLEFGDAFMGIGERTEEGNWYGVHCSVEWRWMNAS